MPGPRWATTACSASRRATWCRSPSRTAPRRSACAGSSAASNRAARATAIPSRRARSRTEARDAAAQGKTPRSKRGVSLQRLEQACSAALALRFLVDARLLLFLRLLGLRGRRLGALGHRLLPPPLGPPPGGGRPPVAPPLARRCPQAVEAGAAAV